ncbi:hypothetical protein PHMEG_00032510 [Phytophthora megakarya]|uniref:Uncharacterized protein n=1 Tax=Phytophthora megakarya TaxID=4795 RepID=A0A225UVG2_9STRA|nr:hypothetical protein PHMEG_00032510 [Phytophthora megakarya]
MTVLGLFSIKRRLTRKLPVRVIPVISLQIRSFRLLKLYGTHSVRTGVATFACGGSTGGPSIVSVCLHCGWSIGVVQDRYFRYEAAGDQYLGRVVAGLPVHNSDFAVLPPHFSDAADEALKSCIAVMFLVLASEINLRGILRLCLASLVYHAEYLMVTFPSEHPLLSTLLFAKPTILQDLRLKLEYSEPSWMKASGIPPHIELNKKLDKQQKSIDALPSC